MAVAESPRNQSSVVPLADLSATAGISHVAFNWKKKFWTCGQPI